MRWKAALNAFDVHSTAACLRAATNTRSSYTFNLPVPLSGSGNALLLRSCGALRGTCRAYTQVRAWPTASSNRCEAPW